MGKTHLEILKEELSIYRRNIGSKPRYLLLTRKFERELFLEESFKKSEEIDEVIKLRALGGQHLEINVLMVDYIILDDVVRKNDWFQFV